MIYMFSKVPRGSINHSLFDSVAYLLKSITSKLKNDKKIFEFEELFAQYIGRKYCVSFPFARTAIYFALKVKNLPKGTEVIMPPISIKGILDSVLSLGIDACTSSLELLSGLKNTQGQLTCLLQKKFTQWEYLFPVFLEC